MYNRLVHILVGLFCFISLSLFISPQPVSAQSVIGEPCSIWWVDKTQDGWPFVELTWVSSCPISCWGDIAGDYHNQSDVWCVAATPPPNLPGLVLGNACSASTSRTVSLLTGGTHGTWFEIEGPTGVHIATSHTFTDLPEGIFSARARAHNTGGTSGWTGWVSAQHDYSPPVTTHNFVGIQGDNGWYTSPVSVSFNANDSGCFGVSATSYDINGNHSTYAGVPFTLSDDGYHTLTYASTDGHHPEAPQSATIPIDQIPPTLTLSPDRPLDAGSWWNAPVTVTLSAHDATSGIAYVGYELNGNGWVAGDSLTISSDGVHSLDAQAVDQAGHLTYDGVYIPIDQTPPTLTVNLYGEQGDNTWFISPPTMELLATDATSGVAGILYAVGDGDWTRYHTPMTFTHERLYDMQVLAVDHAQNISQHTFQIGYDITPPHTTAILTETDDGMQVMLSGWDAASGIQRIHFAVNGVWGIYHHAFTVTETGEYWVQFYAVDYAGNIESEKLVHFVLADATAQIIQAPPPAPPMNPPPVGGGLIPYIGNPPVLFEDVYPNDPGLTPIYPAPTGNSPVPYIGNTPVLFEDMYPAIGDDYLFGDDFEHDRPISRAMPIRIPEVDMDSPLWDGNPPTTNSGGTGNLSDPTDGMAISRTPHFRDDDTTPNIIQTLEGLTAPAVTMTASPATIPMPVTSPLDGLLVTLATLGVVTATAGALTMTASAQAKQSEQQAQQAQALATLQAQQSAQAQSASANWVANQQQQAQAYKTVYTQVTQSQANVDFWTSYTLWLYHITDIGFTLQSQTNLNSLLQILRADRARLCGDNGLGKQITDENYEGLSQHCKDIFKNSILPLLCNNSTQHSEWDNAYKGLFQRAEEYILNPLDLDRIGRRNHRNTFNSVQRQLENQLNDWLNFQGCGVPFGGELPSEVKEVVEIAKRWTGYALSIEVDDMDILYPTTAVRATARVGDVVSILQNIRQMSRVGGQSTPSTSGNPIYIKSGGGSGIKYVM